MPRKTIKQTADSIIEENLTMFENAFETPKSNVDPTADMSTYPEPTVEGLKVAVVGSRTYGMTKEGRRWVYDLDSQQYQTILRTLTGFHAKHPIALVVSGGAGGADSIGEGFALAQDIATHIHLARWQEGPQTGMGQYGPYNPKAGHNRNTAIVRDADIVLAFTSDWSKSKGTADTIKKAFAAKKPTWVFDTKQGQYFTNPAADALIKQWNQ